MKTDEQKDQTIFEKVIEIGESIPNDEWDKMKTDLPERLRMIAESVTEWDNPITAKDDCLQAANRLEQWEKELSSVMPKDFKDWWQNSKDEWPLVAKMCIERLRADNEEMYKQVAALNQKITSLGKCGLNGTCACSYENPGDVCDFHSPKISNLRAENENLKKQMVNMVCDIGGLRVENHNLKCEIQELNSQTGGEVTGE